MSNRYEPWTDMLLADRSRDRLLTIYRGPCGGLFIAHGEPLLFDGELDLAAYRPADPDGVYYRTQGTVPLVAEDLMADWQTQAYVIMMVPLEAVIRVAGEDYLSIRDRTCAEIVGRVTDGKFPLTAGGTLPAGWDPQPAITYACREEH